MLQPWQVRLLTVGLGLGVAVGLGMMLRLLTVSHPGWDQSWYLYAASLVADGVKLYGPRLTETNPPLIIYFSLIPIVLSRVLPLGPMVILKVVLVGMSLGSALWCARLLRVEAVRAPIVLFFAACATVLMELRVEPNDLGQREQILVMLTLPYLVAAILQMQRRLGPMESIALGFAAGLGFCLKPQQILVLVALELFLAFWTRSLGRARCVTFLTLVATVAAYLLLVRVSAPGYFAETIPMLRNTYWAFGFESSATLLRSARSPELGFLLFGFVWIALRKRLHQPLLPVALVVCSVAAWIAYMIQHTGWPYQRIPMNAFFELAAAALVLDLCAPVLLRVAQAPGFGWLLSLSTALGCAAVFTVVMIRPQQVDPVDRYAARRHFLATYPSGTPVYVFSSGLGGFETVFDRHLVWASRFAHLWMVPAIVDNEYARVGGPTPRKILPPETIASLSSVQRTDTAEDLALWKPTVVLVERCTPKQGCYAITDPAFDYIRWFSRDPAFVAEWAKYERQASPTEDFDVYTRMR